MKFTLEASIRKASTAPFYAENGLLQTFLQDGFDALPITRPNDIRDNPLAFIPRDIDPESLLGPFTTSGTTGKAKSIYLSPQDTRDIAHPYFDGFPDGLAPTQAGDLYVVSMLDRPGSLGRYIADEIIPCTGYKAEVCSPLDPEKLADRILQIRQPFYLRTGLPIVSRVLEILLARGANPQESGLRGIQLGGSVMPSAALARIQEAFAADTIGIYGMTEIGGAFVAIETQPCSGIYRFARRHYMLQELLPSAQHPGLHEVVLTMLGREGTQLVRYGTQDLVRVKPDGQSFEVVGRFDDELIFGHMNFIWNTEVELAISRRLGSSHFSVVLERDSKGMDTFVLSLASGSSEREIISDFVRALGSIDPVAEQHFSAGYYHVAVRKEVPTIKQVGHKVKRFHDARVSSGKQAP
jgi:phenylacetate-coenzyme A ligase PaaK-like adenylate-forming protein